VSNPSPRELSSLAAGFQVVAGLWGIALGSPALLVLATADTWDGRAFGLLALAVGLGPLGVVWARRRFGRTWWPRGFVFAGAIFGLAILILARAPTGAAAQPCRVTHQFGSPATGYRRWVPANLLPEEDQLLAAFTVAQAVDPLLTAAQCRQLKRLTRSLYRQLEADADFRALGSMMQNAYDDVIGVPDRHRHSYVYVPRTLDRTRPAPVLVFFHGSGGNFKAYSWILAEVADRLGFIVVAPTNGFGNWREADTLDCLDAALRGAEHVAKVDRTRVHVMGLSNGGLAISQLAGAQGARFASLIFLSPVFDDAQIKSAEFARQCRDRPVLVLTGAGDDRIPLDYVETNVRQMEQRGVRVEMQVFTDANHFLIFSHRRKMIDALLQWLARKSDSRP
jgi:predicted esterase